MDVSEGTKIFGTVLLLLSPLFYGIVAHTAAYSVLECAGFYVSLYYLWPIVAIMPLVSYTRMGIRMPPVAYRVGVMLSGLLYGYLFYSLTAPRLECGWPLNGVAHSSAALWALAVALLYVAYGAINIPIGYITLISASEFYIFYSAYALYKGYILFP